MKSYKIITVLALSLTIIGCTSLKRTTASQTTVATDYTQAADAFLKQEQRLDLAIEMLSSTKEQINEWISENIDYEEQRYDSLGRLIGNIKKTTNRASGKETAKTDNKAVYFGLSIQQVDSILSTRLTSLKADLMIKEKTVEKVGLSWWQELLMWSGALTCLVVIFFSLKFIIRFVWK